MECDYVGEKVCRLPDKLEWYCIVFMEVLPPSQKFKIGVILVAIGKGQGMAGRWV